jgi:hypothetical protein
MSARLIAIEGDTVRIELNIKLSRSMLESEEAILRALNEAGCVATGEALKRFDADGSAILIGGMKWKEKGASMVLSLRALVLTQTRWDQFWRKVDQYGFPIAA